jgi:integrase
LDETKGSLNNWIARNVNFYLNNFIRRCAVRAQSGLFNRDIDLLPSAIEALIDQRKRTGRKSGHVFLDLHGKPLTADHMREVIWKPALEKAGIEYRPMMQTRHTFATISLSEGENIGWVQHMLGHSSLQMIFTKYYAWMPKETRNDGSAMMRAYESLRVKKEMTPDRSRRDSQFRVRLLPPSANPIPHSAS